MPKTKEAPVTKTEQARTIFADALATMRKPRGNLKFVNVDLRNELITSFVDDAGFAKSSATKAFSKIKAELLEAGAIGEAPPEPEVVEKAPRKIALAEAAFNGLIHELNTTDISAHDFRAKAIAAIQKANGANEATACANYNTCKSRATLAGLISEGRLGRGGEPVDRNQPWVRLNANGDPVEGFHTKAAASEGLVEGQSVSKTAELEAA